MVAPFKVKVSDKLIEVEGTISIENRALANTLKRLGGDSQVVLRQLIEKSVQLGILALSVDDNAIFLNQMEAEIGRRLTEIRLIEMNREVEFIGSDSKGKKAERDVVSSLEFLSGLFGFSDDVERVGNDSASGFVRRLDGTDAQLGDAVIRIADSEVRIAVESKMDDSSNLFDPSDPKSFKSSYVASHARTQSLGAQANRNAEWAIFVANSTGPVQTKLGALAVDVDFNDKIVFCIINQELDDFDALSPAYLIARAFALAETLPTIQDAHLRAVCHLLLKSIADLKTHESTIRAIEASANSILAGAGSLLGDFNEEIESINSATEYLTAIMKAKGSSDCLDLKIQKINLLAGGFPAKKGLRVAKKET